MPIKTKQVYKSSEQSDGLRILITRFYPRGLKNNHFHAWIRDLSPSIELLSNYKNGIYNWEEFQYKFVSELAGNINSIENIHSLNKLSNYTDITFLCYEKDGLPCHRHLVKDIVETPVLLSILKS